ncbi:MAG: hypothetical protein QHJ73_09905, partial [Armatimonadota bacterium]|nr:hypothetical protein [Armatimonadota bacterium]
HNEGRWFELTGERQPIHLAKVPPSFGNGLILYRPTYEGDAATFDNLVLEGDTLRPRVVERPATLIYRLTCPYILSDLRVEAVESGPLRLALSYDEGKTWSEAARVPEKRSPLTLSLLPHVSARYAFWLRVGLEPGASVRGLRIRTTFVASPLALPETLSLGVNRCRLIGASPAVPVRTTIGWVERHQSSLGISLNALGFHTMGDEAYRRLYVASPGSQIPVRVALQGRAARGTLSLENLPAGWRCEPPSVLVEGEGSEARFALTCAGGEPGEVHAFTIVFQPADGTARDARVFPAQVLLADAPLAVLAAAGTVAGAAQTGVLPGLAGDQGVAFAGEGSVLFPLATAVAGCYALWVRARWEPNSATGFRLAVEGTPARDLRATAMIGFTDWESPRAAHTKMFAHYGEFPGQWAWYRVPDVDLFPGTRQVKVEAGAGTALHALVLLPQNAEMDRAGMNLFQNWNYAPWENPWK